VGDTMAQHIVIFIKDEIEEKSIWDFVLEQNGYLIESSSNKQGVLEEGEGTIWINYGLEFEWWKDELEAIRQIYNADSRSYISIDIGSYEGSQSLVREFCLKFTEVYTESYLFDLQGNLFENKELRKLKLITTDEETYWELFSVV
jgi:uncharacterized protein (UPF0216 family)